jgi:hypothetical protein
MSLGTPRVMPLQPAMSRLTWKAGLNSSGPGRAPFHSNLTASIPVADAPARSTSRRRFLTLSVGGALAGAAWTAGLAVLARGHRPQLFAIGTGTWQVILVEHGSSRVLFLAGQFDESPETHIDRLCGLLRQHLDVVVGDGNVLGLLSSGFRDRRAVSTFVETDGSALATGTNSHQPLTRDAAITVGALDIVVYALRTGEWLASAEPKVNWLARISHGALELAIAPSLDLIAQHGFPATLGVAPIGSPARLWKATPGMAVATNARDDLGTLATGVPLHLPTKLVRTFPEDIAAFELRQGRLRLPDWVEGNGVSRLDD